MKNKLNNGAEFISRLHTLAIKNLFKFHKQTDIRSPPGIKKGTYLSSPDPGLKIRNILKVIPRIKTINCSVPDNLKSKLETTYF